MYFSRKFISVALQCLGANTNFKCFINSEMSQCVVKDLSSFAVVSFPVGIIK